MKNIGSMASQNFQNFEKDVNSDEIFIFYENFSILKKRNMEVCGMERHSTSFPCGNLVDGLPHDCHTETVAKPGRLGPVQNGKLMQKFVELSMFCSMT